MDSPVVLTLKLEKREYDLIAAALAELPLKAVPGQYRNQLLVKLRRQVERQLHSQPDPDSPIASNSSSTARVVVTERCPETSTPHGE